MPHKKAQLAPKLEGLPPLQEPARTFFGERSGHQSLRADLKSIASATRLLPAEVAPPARVWRTLRVQLEKEGILSRSVKVIITTVVAMVSAALLTVFAAYVNGRRIFPRQALSVFGHETCRDSAYLGVCKGALRGCLTAVRCVRIQAFGKLKW